VEKNFTFLFQENKEIAFPNKTRLIFDEDSQIETSKLNKIKISKRKVRKVASFLSFLEKLACVLRDYFFVNYVFFS
jgi:hypothetical protein